MEGKRIFVTGISTGIGKTLVSAILTEALGADYWKPVQAGLDEQTDTETVRALVSNGQSRFWEEAFALQTPASPHLAARIDNVRITLDALQASFDRQWDPSRTVIIEGAGGLLVPLNDTDFFPDLATRLSAALVVVSSQYLGNINHSLLTAEVLRGRKLPVLGWVFNGTYHVNQEDILRWSGFPRLGQIDQEEQIDKAVVGRYAEKLRPALLQALHIEAS